MPVLTDPQGWFTLHVPDGWAMATEDSVTTLRRPGGIVYLSAMDGGTPVLKKVRVR